MACASTRSWTCATFERRLAGVGRKRAVRCTASSFAAAARRAGRGLLSARVRRRVRAGRAREQAGGASGARLGSAARRDGEGRGRLAVEARAGFFSAGAAVFSSSRRARHDEDAADVHSMGDPADDKCHPVSAADRGLIQLYYTPASRDAAAQVRATAGALAARLLRAIEWSA